MKSRFFSFTAGLLLGMAILGNAAASEGITAVLSTQPIYVDGQRVSMTAYAINGNNYVRLRDIGKAVFPTTPPPTASILTRMPTMNRRKPTQNWPRPPLQHP